LGLAARDRITTWLHDHRERMLAFVSDLVRIPSENPPGNRYGECVDRIEKELAELGFAPIQTAEGLVVEGRFGHGRPLYFSGHYDVVPAQTRAQFEPLVRDGLLFGRGTSDMKGGIASMMYAGAAVAACGVRLDGELVLRFVPDEETGGGRGTALLSRTEQIASNAVGMITAEPTSGVVWHASRGAVSWRITAFGREAHVGLHYEGVNAFEAILEVANELHALDRELHQRRTGHPVTDERARQPVLLIGGQVDSGANFNIVPGRATMTVDRRTNPEERLDEARAGLEACIDRVRARGAHIEVEVIQEGDPSETSIDAPLSRALAAAIVDVTGSPPTFEMCPALLETRFYSARGVPALAYGPGELSVAHGPLEHVDPSRLLESAAVYAMTALAVLQ
jgi:acetylornithine deacetylase/succinyl-diaminopimelate desuccinylase family protein